MGLYVWARYIVSAEGLGARPSVHPESRTGIVLGVQSKLGQWECSALGTQTGKQL